MTKAQLKDLEAGLWRAADNLRAISELKSSGYATPTRDLLLPRLISGKLPVESLPIAFPASMATEPANTPARRPASGRRYVTYTSQT